MTKILGLILFCLPWALALAAGPLDDKGPPYFVDRYGPADTSKTRSAYSFSSSPSTISIKGPFSVRIYRKDKLQIEAVFFLPSLKLAAVNLSGLSWTDEQIQAALKGYGGDWQPVKRANSIVREWVAPDGSSAVFLLSSLHIKSKAVVDAVARELAEQDSKRKAVPTF